ncbi:MAG TPA: MarR family winged helix-turn-helix transcriptional regulator [Novosphingobium sp.]|nr:MarR family winged helix-turn-helix transcriptional regulator [Novosphingobium sp.]
MEQGDTVTARVEGADSGDGNNWLAGSLPYKIYRVSSLMNLRLQGRLKAKGINLSQWRVLSVLRSCGRISMGQIVEQTLMEQPTISRVIAQLQQDGLVMREASSEDSRVSLISLSPSGLAMFDDIAPQAARHQATALEGFGPDDVATLVRLLSHIEDNIARDR